MIEVRVDADPDAGAHIQNPLQEMKDVPSKSVTCFYASHVLEHVPWHELFGVMKEIQRVVKEDGFAVVAVPDLACIADWLKDERIIQPVYQTSTGGIIPLDMIYGHRQMIAQGMAGMQHRTGFNAYLLDRVFRDSGWRNVIILKGNNELFAVASQGIIPEDINDFLGL